MISVLVLQLSVTIFVILSIALVVNQLLKISLNKSFIISICLIILISMLLHKLNLYKFTINILIIISIIPFLFLKIRNNILEQKSLIAEFITLLLSLFFLSFDRILMDEDELYFWAVKFKYFVMHFTDINNYNVNLIEEPYKFDGYGNSTALFQSFINSFIGYNEGGAIFANNIIILSAFYFLFGDRLKKFSERIIYLLILYLVLNNLSFGFISIYADPIVAMFFAVLVYYLYSDFNYKNIKYLILLLILIITFFEIHRISILFMGSLLILFIMKKFKDKKDINKVILSMIISLVFLYLVIYNVSAYNLNLKFLSQIDLSSIVLNFINIFLSRSYSSQFGVSYNEILNHLQIDFLSIHEYVWHNFIWYFACIILAIINGKKIIKLNIFFLITFFIFAAAIILNKVYIESTSPQVFGRYISFVIIPCILINLVYYTPVTKYKYLSLFIITGILVMSTPKKTFGFFFPRDIYSKYDSWNNNYYMTRDRHNQLFKKIYKSFDNELFNSIAVFKDNDIIYDDHPSLYQSALKVDLYPNGIEIVTFNQLIEDDFNFNYYFKSKNVLIFYNLNSNQKKVVEELIERFGIKQRYDLTFND
tara:strand:+ start:1565 stop:3343 length:1779 start_codon:yes stop_codon:yes gene_type:complete